MYVCVHVCMCVCVCVCIYTYVRTCYVLTNPSIPSSRSKHFIFLRPNFFYIARELTQGSPLVTTFKIFFIFMKLSHRKSFKEIAM